VGKCKLRICFKNPLQRTDELLNLSRNQLSILIGHCHLKGHLFKLRLVNSLECDRCKQALETASHVLCDCEALATLRYKYLGWHFMKPGDSEDIFVSKILHFVQGVGLLNERAQGLHKRSIRIACMGHSVPTLLYSILFYSILFLFYSIITVHSILLLSILSAFLQIRWWNGPTNAIQLLAVLKVNKYYSCYQTSWVWAETKTCSYFYCETGTQKAFMIS
jgi:hypothetical protein